MVKTGETVRASVTTINPTFQAMVPVGSLVAYGKLTHRETRSLTSSMIKLTWPAEPCFHLQGTLRGLLFRLPDLAAALPWALLLALLPREICRGLLYFGTYSCIAKKRRLRI